MSATPPQRGGEGGGSGGGGGATGGGLLGGGGRGNWFDPLTLIKAIAKLSLEREDIKLIFMGIKHPNSAVPEMKMTTQAIALATELGLLDKHVFFNYGWTPYEERQSFLLEADIGVSTHFNHLETQYSFRTRMLDYMWAGLPILATEGDAFADIIATQNLGKIVPYENVQAIVEAIKALICDQKNYAAIKHNLSVICPLFHWNKVVEPIETMIDHFMSQPKSRLTINDMSTIFTSICRDEGPLEIARFISRRLVKKFKPK